MSQDAEPFELRDCLEMTGRLVATLLEECNGSRDLSFNMKFIFVAYYNNFNLYISFITVVNYVSKFLVFFNFFCSGGILLFLKQVVRKMEFCFD